MFTISSLICFGFPVLSTILSADRLSSDGSGGSHVMLLLIFFDFVTMSE